MCFPSPPSFPRPAHTTFPLPLQFLICLHILNSVEIVIFSIFLNFVLSLFFPCLIFEPSPTFLSLKGLSEDAPAIHARPKSPTLSRLSPRFLFLRPSLPLLSFSPHCLLDDPRLLPPKEEEQSAPNPPAAIKVLRPLCQSGSLSFPFYRITSPSPPANSVPASGPIFPPPPFRSEEEESPIGFSARLWEQLGSSIRTITPPPPPSLPGSLTYLFSLSFPLPFP